MGSARAILTAEILVITEMTSILGSRYTGGNGGRSTLARAGHNRFTLLLMVFYLLSVSSRAAVRAAAATSGTYESERVALLSMYANAWLNKTGPDPCQDAWPGITCDGGSPYQHVIAINLSGTDGIVPVQFFTGVGSLPELDSLSLAGCDLVGNLSSAFGNLSSLPSLLSLDLSRNSLAGEIPSISGIAPSLQSLLLTQNQLQGVVPTDFCQFKSLTVLMMDGNSLVGSIPPCLGNLSTLGVLNISYNNLTGFIPESLGQLGALTELDLALNSLTGPLPTSLTGLSNLTKLHLSGNSLEGPLPVDFYRMSRLQELYLDSNQFTGPIPVSICSLQSLQKLRLFDNRLTGSIPEGIGNLTQLTVLFLHANQLSGPLPVSLGNLTLLQELQVQGNRFNGALQGEIFIGLQKNLQGLYLHFNELEGEIPVQILFLTAMVNVSLGFNRFNGSIPDPRITPGVPFQSAANLQLLSMCNNSLTGPIPAATGELGNLKFLDFSNNKLDGSIPPQLTSQINSQRVQANLLFNDFDPSSWSTIQGASACLQVANATLPQQCPVSAFSTELAINVGGSEFKSAAGMNFVADNSFSSVLGFYSSANSSENSSGMGVLATPWVVSDQGVVQENSVSIIASSSGPPTAGTLGSIFDDGQNSMMFPRSDWTALMVPPSDWTLFQTARVGGDTLSYKIGSLGPGNYAIDLFFAELDTSVYRPGQRVFSVFIQRELRCANLDIFNTTGGVLRPLILSFPVSIEHGVIDVLLVGRGSWPATQEQMIVYRGPILSALNVHHVKKSKHWVVLIVAAAGGGSLLALAIIFSVWVSCVVSHRRRKTQMKVCNWNNVGFLSFKYAKLEAATNKFSQANSLGQGAFGRVFKGVLPDGAVIAIKQLSIPNPNSLECLQNELQVISTVRHRNLVPLIGCCLELECPILVCEYMPNGNLHDALFKESSPVVLSWSTRCKIALDVARGLHYLHEESVHKIVHRDVKPVNILLDSKLSAHIADFGMARLVAEQEIEVFTGVMGTRGYMAPEYALHGHLSDKVDVFSFGVVLLELVAGRRGMQSGLTSPAKIHLFDWAWQVFTAGEFLELIDKRLGKDYVFSEVITMLKIAIWCTEYNQSLRPCMSQVLHMLTRQESVPPLPYDRKAYSDEELLDFCRGRRWPKYDHIASTDVDQDPTPSLELTRSQSRDHANSDHDSWEGM